MSEHPPEESFLHDHGKELMIGSAVGAIGLIFAITAKRLHAKAQETADDMAADEQSELPNENS